MSVVCLLGALSAPPRAQAMLLGIQDDSVLLEHRYYDAETALQEARALGARVVRFNIISTSLAKTGFAPYDEAIRRARRDGMQVHLTLMGAPRYLHPKRWQLSYWNPSPARFAGMAARVARRYRGEIRSYGIWNEPNLGQFLGPARRAPEIYARLYQAAYRVIRRADPHALIFIGETTSTRKLDALRFLRRAAGYVRGGLRADGFAHHPFQFDRPPNRISPRYMGIGATKEIRERLRKLARKDILRTRRGTPLPIYYTEFSYNRHGSIYPSTERRRAAWSRLAVRVARRDHVRLLLFYQLIEQPPWARVNQTWNSALINSRGRAFSAYGSIQRAWRQPLLSTSARQRRARARRNAHAHRSAARAARHARVARVR